MDDETKSIYSLLQDIFKNVWEQQKYSEVKNGVLLTLNIAMFAIVVRVYFQVKSVIISSNYTKIAFFILILLFIIHIILILQSFFPKDSNKEEFKEGSSINIFFFGDIEKVTSEKYLELVVKKISANTDINKVLLLDLSNQIVILSEITQFKYISFKKNIHRMYKLGVLFVIYFSWLFFCI